MNDSINLVNVYRFQIQVTNNSVPHFDKDIALEKNVIEGKSDWFVLSSSDPDVGESTSIELDYDTPGVEFDASTSFFNITIPFFT